MSVANWRKAVGKALISVEREWLRSIASSIALTFKNPVIVNIGIFRGASMYCMFAGAPNAEMYGIDIQYPQGHKLDPKMKAKVLVGDSAKLHLKFDKEIHLLFIDGDHRYPAVKNDIVGWTPKVAVGGYVIFHDFKTEPKVAAKHAGVKRAILEWEAKAKWDLMPDMGSMRTYRRPPE